MIWNRVSQKNGHKSFLSKQRVKSIILFTQFSPHLRAGKIKYPLQCFLDPENKLVILRSNITEKKYFQLDRHKDWSNGISRKNVDISTIFFSCFSQKPERKDSPCQTVLRRGIMKKIVNLLCVTHLLHDFRPFLTTFSD